jgi:hypothetical protein
VLPSALPVNTVPAGQTTYIDTTKRFRVADSNPVKVADNDSPLVTATLTCSSGILEVIPNVGVIVSNNISTRVVVMGSTTNVNRAFDGLRWTPTPAFSGTATITLRTSDGDNIDTDTFNVVVSGTAPPYVPPGPTNSVPSGTKMVPYGYTLNFSGDGITVYDPDVATLTTTLTMVGGIVHVTPSGAAVTGNDTGLVTLVGTQTQISAALGTLIFTHNGGFWGYAKITVSTNDGPKTSANDINIVVGVPALPPVQLVPPQPFSVSGFTAGSNIKFTSGPGPDNSMKITAAYKMSLRTTISCGHGIIKYDANATGYTNLADGCPTKVLYGYWNGAAATTMRQINNYWNVIGMARARNAGSGLGGGAVSWPYATGNAGVPLPHDVQFIRACGKPVLLVVGGPGYGFNYTTRAQSDALLGSLIPLIYAMGGVDGIDIQFYDGDLTGLSLTTEAVYIAQQLKAAYGSKFMIVYSFRQNPASQQVKDIAVALHNADCLTLVQQIFMDNAANKVANAVSSKVLQFITDTQIPRNKHMIGMSHNYDYTNNLTLAEAVNAYQQTNTVNTAFRGVSCWSIDLDAAVTGSFSTEFKWTQLGYTLTDKGTALITGHSTRQVTLTGDYQQINSALASFYYYPDLNYQGPDPVVMTTTDGTLSDTDSINVTVMN